MRWLHTQLVLTCLPHVQLGVGLALQSFPTFFGVCLLLTLHFIWNRGDVCTRMPQWSTQSNRYGLILNTTRVSDGYVFCFDELSMMLLSFILFLSCFPFFCVEASFFTLRDQHEGIACPPESAVQLSRHNISGMYSCYFVPCQPSSYRSPIPIQTKSARITRGCACRGSRVLSSSPGACC